MFSVSLAFEKMEGVLRVFGLGVRVGVGVGVGELVIVGLGVGGRYFASPLK